MADSTFHSIIVEESGFRPPGGAFIAYENVVKARVRKDSPLPLSRFFLTLGLGLLLFGLYYLLQLWQLYQGAEEDYLPAHWLIGALPLLAGIWISRASLQRELLLVVRQKGKRVRKYSLKAMTGTQQLSDSLEELANKLGSHRFIVEASW